MKQDLLIFPYSGTGIEALDCLGDNFNCIGFISDDNALIGNFYAGIEIFSRQALLVFPNSLVLAVPGSPNSFSIRETIIQGLGVEQNRYATVIHPAAHVSKNAKIGINTLIMAFVSIGPNVVIGNNICILPSSTIHHDSLVHDYSIVCGNVLVAGNVVIEKNCYIGAGSTIINGCTIGNKSLVGLGSNVIKTIPHNSKIAGNPAKEIGK